MNYKNVIFKEIFGGMFPIYNTDFPILYNVVGKHCILCDKFYNNALNNKYYIPGPSLGGKTKFICWSCEVDD